MINTAIKTQGAAARQGHHSTQTTALEFKLALLDTAIENFSDGLLIVTKTGDILHKNRCAQQLLTTLNHQYKTLKAIPKIIWQACQALINGQDLFSTDEHIVLEDEIETQDQGRIRMRVQWFNLDTQDCFLVTLEDLSRSVEYCAQTDAQHYGLTPRETEVWQLRRAHYSYKEIAAQLYISENTVKKHLKNVYAKREQARL